MKMLQLFFLLVILTALAGGTLYGNTVIKGEVKNAGNRDIRIRKYQDYLSMTPVQLAKVQPGENGQFTLNFFISQTEYMILSIGFKEAYLFVQPGDTLTLEIDYKTRIEKPQGTLPLKQPLDIKFGKDRDTSIQGRVFEFDSLFSSSFTAEKIKYIIYQRNVKMYDSLKHMLMEQVEKMNNPYLHTYAEYSLLQFEYQIYPQRMRDIGEKYIAGRELQYRHLEYMKSFESFVRSYVPARSKNISPAALADSINKGRGIKALDNLLGKDTIFRNEQLREMASIALLKNCYSNENYKRKAVSDLLGEISEKSKFPRHKQMARNVKLQLQKNTSDRPVKDFAFPEYSGDSIRISDYRGRYLLLNFFQADCLHSRLEMDVMNKLYKEHQNNIYLLSISLDDQYNKYERFVRSSDYPWDIVHFAWQYELVDYFRLRSVPRFMLLNYDGTIYKEYIPALSKGGLEQINRLMEKIRK
ncbi:MAG: TlpA disulfide reductase family protein [Bacteroidales bacterium]